jgi:purine-binding chemotaxis protein CheW
MSESIPSIADTRAILKARAKALASEPPKQRSAEQSVEIVEFVLATEHYALEDRFVREVYPLKDLTPLPCTPAFVYGIINVRGEIVAVLDMRRFFDLPVQGLSDLNKVIMLESDDMRVGILADRIEGVRSILQSQIQPSLPTLTGIRSEFLRGVTSDRLVIIDAAKMLADEKILVQEEVS